MNFDELFHYIIHFTPFSHIFKSQFQILLGKQNGWILFCYLMGLDPLDVAGEITVEMELINVFVFSLCSWLFVFCDSLLLLLFLQCCFGYRWLNRHETVLTPDAGDTGRGIGVTVTLAEIETKPQRKSERDKCVKTVLQRFHVSKCLRVFGNHISQDVLHTCSHFLHWGQSWYKNTNLWEHIHNWRKMLFHLVYALPSTPGFTQCLRSSVCGVSINAEAAPSRPSALALRAFVSLLPFL